MRLERGEMAQATVFNDDPAAQARTFAAQGFSRLHIVDLNGAFAGRPVNARRRRGDPCSRSPSPCSSAAASAISPPSRCGSARACARVILGTAAVQAIRRWCGEACRRFPGRIVVGIDAAAARWPSRAGRRRASSTAIELARRFEDAGRCRHRLHRHRPRRRAGRASICRPRPSWRAPSSIPVIASGGLAGIDDVRGTAAARVCYAAGCHRRPRALRRPARCQRGAVADRSARSFLIEALRFDHGA